MNPVRLRKLAIAAAAALIAVAMLYALRWTFLGGVVRNYAESASVEFLDSSVTVGEVSGSLVRSVTLTGIEFHPRPESAIGAGSIERATVVHRVFGISRIELTGLRIDLRERESPPDEAEDAVLAEILAEALRVLDSPPDVPPIFARDISVRSGGMEFAFEAVEVRPLERGFAATARLKDEALADIWPCRDRLIEFTAGTGESALDVRGECSLQGGTAVASARVKRRDGSGRRRLEVATGGTAPEAHFAGWLRPDADGLDGRLQGRFDLSIIDDAAEGEAAFASRVGLSFTDFAFELSLTGAAEPAAWNGIAAGSALVEAEVSGPEKLDVRLARVELADVRLEDGLRLDSVRAKARMRNGIVLVRELRAERGADFALASGAYEIDTEGLSFEFEGSVADIQPYLGALMEEPPSAGPFAVEGAGTIEGGTPVIDARVTSSGGRYGEFGWRRLAAGVAFEAGRVVVSGVEIEGGPGGADFGAAAVLLHDDGRRWEVDRATVRLGEDTITFDGEVAPFGPSADLIFEGEAHLPSEYLPEGARTLEGRVGLSGEFRLRPDGYMIGFDATSDDFAAGGHGFERATLRAAARGPLAAAGVLHLEELDVESRQLGLSVLAAGDAELREDGKWSAEVAFRDLMVFGEEAVFDAPLAASSGPAGAVEIEPAGFQWAGLKFEAEAAFDSAGAAIRAQATVERIEETLALVEARLPRFDAPPLTGRVGVRLEIRGGPDAGGASALVKGEDLAWSGQSLGRLDSSFALSWPAERSEGSLAFAFALDGPAIDITAEGDAPVGVAEAAAPLSLNLRARTVEPVRTPGLPWQGVELALDVSGVAGAPELAGELTLTAEEFDPEELTPRVSMQSVRFGYRDELFAVEPVRLELPFGTLQVGGEIPVVAALAPGPRIDLLDRPMRLNAVLAVDDVGEIASLVPGFPDLSGRLLAEAEVVGTTLRPQPSVRARLGDGTLGVGGIVPEIQSLEARARMWPEGVIELEEFRGLMGHGLIEAEGTFQPWAGVGEGRLRGRDALLASDSESTLRVRGDLDLGLMWRDGLLGVSGRALLTKVLYFREFPGGEESDAAGEDVLDSIGVDFPLAPGGGILVEGVKGLDWVRLDVDVETNGEARIENSLFAAILDASLRFGGTAEEIAISGRIEAESGEIRAYPGIFLPLIDFRLTFPREEGAEPSILFQSRTFSGLTQVYIRAVGSLADPTINLFSDPPFSESELLTLLAFGLPPGTVEDPAATLISQAGRVVTGLVTDRFPQARPEGGFFSRLAFTTGVETRESTQLLPQQQASQPSSGLVIRAEYIINRWLSFLTRRDAAGEVASDVRLRLAWPRTEEPLIVTALLPPPLDPPETDREIVFARNRRVASRTLRETIAPEIRAGLTTAGISDAAFRIERHYYDLGHYFAQVAYREEGRNVEFLIYEGPLVRLGRIEFRGNRALGDESLRQALFAGTPGFVRTPFSRRLVAANSESLLAHYRARGFLDAGVVDENLRYDQQEKVMDIIFEIEEGPRFTLRQVDVRGVPEEDAAEVAAIVRRFAGRTLDAGLPDRLASEVRDYFRAEGRPIARATETLELDYDAAAGDILLMVSPGPKVYVRSVSINGVERVSETFLRRRLNIEVGQPLVIGEVRAAERRLLETGLFQYARVMPVGIEANVEDRTAAGVEVLVQEAPKFEASLSGGYGSFDGLRFGLQFVNRNVFGRGEMFRIGGEVTEATFRVESEVNAPYFGRRMTLGLSALYEQRTQPSFSYDYFGIAPIWQIRTSSRSLLSAGVRFDNVSTRAVVAGVPPGDLLDFSDVVPFIGHLMDSRDSAINPRRGYFVSAQVEHSPERWSDISYTRVSAAGAFFLPISRDFTFGFSINGGVIAPQGGTGVIPIALRFFSGGIGSVRGIPSQELGPDVGGQATGGEVFVAAQSELRFRLWRDLHAAVFIDRGNVFFARDDFDIADTRIGYGAGLRYLTPVGFIVVDIGVNADPSPGEPESIAYLSFGLPF